MCKEIKESNSINITKYSTQMNILNKEGFTLKKKEKDHRQKILGAILSSGIVSIIFILLILFFTFIQFLGSARMPWIVYIIFMILLGIPQYGIIYNLISRIKKIKGGEEDEASKY